MKALKAIPALGFCVMLVFGLAACGEDGDTSSGSGSSSYSIGGTISGLAGSGLVLQNNSGDDLSISAGAANFTFTTKIADTTGYSVTVKTQPTSQNCTVANGSGTISGANVTNVAVTCVSVVGSVSALYPTNGSGWNDYVKNDGASIFTATDTACNAASDTACIHGGEMRAVTVLTQSSCAVVTASDALGAFDWTCDASTNPVRVVSTGLKDGKNLSDLIDFDAEAWKQNSVTVSYGLVSATTASTSWWSNPIAADNDGGYLNGAGTIYVVTGTGDLPGRYIINASGAGLVAKPGAIINGPGAGPNSHVVTAFAKDFLWIEGSVDAAGDDVGVYLKTVRFSALRGVTVENADVGNWKSGVVLDTFSNNTLSGVAATNNVYYGVWLYSSSDNNTLSGVTASNNGFNGVYLYGSSNNNTLSGVTATNNGNIGVLLSLSSNNTLSGVTAANNGTGVNLSSSSDNNTLSGVTATNNGYYGVYLASSNNTLTGVTASNNGDHGVYINSSTNNTLSGVTATNNGFNGVYLESSSNNTLSGVAAANNSSGVVLVGSSGNYFTGLLKVGANSNDDCYISNSVGVPTITDPGLDDDLDPWNVETDSTHIGLCLAEGASDFGTPATGITLASSFVGKVTADDAANQSDTNGSADYASITDWSNFQNPYRGWGKDHADAFPSANHRGWCTTGTCRIWDWSLKSGDTGDAGNPAILGVLSIPTGDETLTHTWADASTITFLRNAVEIQGDGLGNENTLCESGETCLYTPNIGSYQGHGSLIDAGAFTGGTITGVTLKKYQTNGY